MADHAVALALSRVCQLGDGAAPAGGRLEDHTPYVDVRVSRIRSQGSLNAESPEGTESQTRTSASFAISAFKLPWVGGLTGLRVNPGNSWSTRFGGWRFSRM